MFDIEEFQQTWRHVRSIGYQRNQYTSFHCSYVDAHLVKKIINVGDLEGFVSMMYSNALLIQVAYGMNFIQETIFKISEQAENTFPRVNGILSTIDKHVCPAVMPTMLLYLCEDEIVSEGNFTFCYRDALKEKNTWIEKAEIFDCGVSQTVDNLKQVMKILFCNHDSNIKNVELQFVESHARIKNSILNNDDSQRVLNY
jgi:hypothetical protein